MVATVEMKSDQYWLSVVIIGRNEGRNLPALFASLPAGKDIEWLYIDSNSEDDSVLIASEFGAKVFLVEHDSIYAPGTGRYIGTKEAAGLWILYLDGDMVLKNEFLIFLKRLRDEKTLPPGTAGFVGRTCNKYLDKNGSVVAEQDYIALSPGEMGEPKNWGKPAFYHGGAVLYARKAVIDAGNWNSAVYQLEEIDLYSRVLARGGVIRAIDLQMVDHYTPVLSLSEKLRLNFLPQWKGKKLYGAGQVVAARFKEGGLAQFIRIYPYPFIIFAALITAPFLYYIWPLLPIIVNVTVAIWLGSKKKWYYYLVYLGNLFQIIRGLGRYKPFIPRYKRVE